MKFEEENHARNLHRELKAHIPRGTNLHLHGREAQWSCVATRGHRTGTIACLHHPGESPETECRIEFDQSNLHAAMGRTTSMQEAIAAVVCWLDGHPIDILHKQFAFVDAQQRALTELEKALLAALPELAEGTTHELRRIVHDLYYLSFSADERSCRICYPGRNPQPDAVFYTEGTELFRFPVSSAESLAPVIKAWLCDALLLAQVHAAFPWIDIPARALDYEAHVLEGRFLQRWNAVQHYYQSGTFPLAPDILGLVHDLRRTGYDRKLNPLPGESKFGVFRAREGRMRPDRPYVAFAFYPGGMVAYSPGWEPLTVEGFKLTPELEARLQQLATTEIV